jgi:UDP-N-acetylmuramate--alanine ligase
MSILDTDDPRPVHFVGIAGAGMSALAELFARRGIRVDGCDTNPAGSLDLARNGIAVIAGHDPSHVDGKRALVVSSAIPRDHPELVRARSEGVRVVRRAEALGEATAGRELIAIAGTHGKTTTTAMAAEALSRAGLAPTALAGGRVAAWQGNLLPGGEDVYVVEADEYDRSFLALSPTIAAITNVEADHLDIYRDVEDILETFTAFASGARVIVVCAEGGEAGRLRIPASSEVIRYGIDDDDSRLIARNLRSEPLRQIYEVEYDGRQEGEVVLRVPGRHNVLNSLAAIGCGIAAGGDLPRLIEGVAAFGGVGRRFEIVGEVAGVTVVDDYAHHPTEISATIEAARSSGVGRRLVIAFQPHLFSRTRDFARGFGEALARADLVLLTEIYPAREQPLEGVSSDLLVDAMRRAGAKPEWRGDVAEVAGALARVARRGDMVLLMGAGDIGSHAPELLELLRRGEDR